MLEELRKRIDSVDAEILAALNRRFQLTGQVRELKVREGLPAVDAARELEVMTRALSACPPAERDVVCGVYEAILRGSRGGIESIVRGVTVHDGRVLLCRANGGKTSYLPGGHIDFGETAAEALVREIKEELGIEATVGKFLGVVENSFLQHGRKHCEINLVYELEFEGDEIAAQEEWITFEWCPIGELEKAGLLPEQMRNIIG